MKSKRHDERPWGSYTVLGGEDGYQVKKIVVEPGKRISYQRHAHRAEHWVIVDGSGAVVVDGVDRDVAPGDVVEVPVGALHRIGAAIEGPLTFIEVQLGDYLGEDDIVRVDDDFGRT